jgi:hypothetical protein
LYSKTICSVFIAAVVGVTAVGCSSDPVPKTEPKPAPTATVDSVSGEPTRKEGAAKYLKIVAPFNDELDKCLPVLNPLLESGESSSSDLPKIRKACAGVAEANRKFAEALTKTAWPTEAQSSISQLVDELHADQLAWQGIAKVRNHQDLFDPKYPLTEDGTAADMVRAHLGLPAVEKVE